ncbi:MAG: hypothetical protein ABSE51_06625 [Terracidiphilus sp.]|jgi:hypothetical protein
MKSLLKSQNEFTLPTTFTTRFPVEVQAGLTQNRQHPNAPYLIESEIYQNAGQIRGTLYSIVEFDLKFLPVSVTAYSQTSTLRSR